MFRIHVSNQSGLSTLKELKKLIRNVSIKLTEMVKDCSSVHLTNNFIHFQISTCNQGTRKRQRIKLRA